MIDTKGSCIAAFALIAAVLLIPPFAFHVRQKNIPACSLIAWLCYSNMVSCINALIWSGQDFASVTEGKGYCDVTVRISSGSSSGKLAAIATLIFNLYMILSASSPRFLDTNSPTRTATNVLMCWATPVFVISTSIIVQTARYIIARYHGCVALYSQSFLSIILKSVWDLVWAAVAVVFAIMTVAAYAQKRSDVKNILRCTSSGLNLRRFARLLVFSILIMLVLAPYAVVSFVFSIQAYGVSGFNLKDEHGPDWGHILKLDIGQLLFASQIIDICLAFFTFLLFGLGSDALKMYCTFLAFLGLRSRSQSPPDYVFTDSITADRTSSNGTNASEATVAPTMQGFDDLKELVFADEEMELSNETASVSASSESTCDQSNFDVIHKPISVQFNVTPK